VPDLAALGARASDVPVAPDAPEAREWAERELSRALYSDSPGLIQRGLDWIGEHLFGAVTGGTTSTATTIVSVLVIGALIVAVVVAELAVGPVRRRAVAAATDTDRALFDDDRDSRDLRGAADAAARAGDHSLAVLERYRAIVRSLDEKSYIDDRPGLTAHEAAALGSRALPEHGGGLRAGADLFDAVRYGDHVATAEDDRRLTDLDERIRSLRRTGGTTVHHEPSALPPSLGAVR
jgi:hypothetical protein